MPRRFCAIGLSTLDSNLGIGFVLLLILAVLVDIRDRLPPL